MLSLFWKKLLLINISLFLIILKIYGYYMHVREENPVTPSLFPEEDENGYPFFDQITCNLQDIFRMTHQLALTPELFADDFNNAHSHQRECSFKAKLRLCKANAHCFHQLQTSIALNESESLNYSLSNDFMLIEEIAKTNCFYFNGNKEDCQEIDLYNDIIRGYLTYKSMQENNKNMTYIKEHVSSSYEKLNSLFFLLSLGVKSGIELGETYLIDNDTLTQKAATECLQLSYNDKLDEKQRKQFQANLNEVKEIVKCVRSNEVYSNARSEIEGIESIVKSFFDISSHSQEEKPSIKQLMKGMIISVYHLFIEDFELKQKHEEDTTNNRLFNVIFWSLMLMFVLFANRYFIKNQEYYSAKSKRFFGKPSSPIHLQPNRTVHPVKATSEAKEVDEAAQGHKASLGEEKEYIDKLKNIKGNTEFIITH